MFGNTVFFGIIIPALHRLVLVKVDRGHTNHIPEPHYHKADIEKQSLFEQRINKISAAKSKETRQNVLRVSLLAFEEVRYGMLAEPEAENGEQQKAYYSRRYKNGQISVM